jgi:hypothetical protein
MSENRTVEADGVLLISTCSVYQDGGEEDHMLTIKLFYRCRTKAHRMRRLHVGTIEVPLTRLIVDKTHDMWLPIIPTCDYQLLWNWQKLGNDARYQHRPVPIPTSPHVSCSRQSSATTSLMPESQQRARIEAARDLAVYI